MDTVKERLKAFIASENLSQGRFEKQVGLSNGFVNNISKSIGAEKMQSILCTYPRLNPDWLLTGEGDMLRTAEAREEGEGEGIAVYDVDFACGFSEFLDSAMHPVGYYSIPPYNDPHKYNIVRSTGDSMLPSIADRAWVVIGRQALSADDVIYGDIYAIETTAEIRTIKRIVRSDDKACVRLVPDNQSPVHGTYQDFAKSSIRACYKVYAALNITTF